MATAYTTTDTYNIVCDELLEPYNSGAAPGLSLGIVTLQNFLDLFGVVIEDFVNRTGLVWEIFTQQIQSGVPTYSLPEVVNEPKVAFVGGQYADHSTLADMDDWLYSWQSASGTPQFWYMDGLPPETVGVALPPNYDGAGYSIPSDPSAVPPFGVYGLFNGSTTGLYSGTLNVSGTAATVLTGAFDPNWNNYYPPPSITIAGVAYPIQSVTDPSDLILAITAGVQSGASWSVSIGNDGNLTVTGPKGLSSITYTLGQVIPVVPDSFCPALAYGILARIFSTDGEAKDLQRSYYCNARYLEYCNAAAAISGEMLANG